MGRIFIEMVFSLGQILCYPLQHFPLDGIVIASAEKRRKYSLKKISASHKNTIRYKRNLVNLYEPTKKTAKKYSLPQNKLYFYYKRTN